MVRSLRRDEAKGFLRLVLCFWWCFAYQAVAVAVRVVEYSVLVETSDSPGTRSNCNDK